MGEDWKGEHLIRSRKHVYGPDPVRTPRTLTQKTICKHEGCGKMIYYGNKSGLCKKHRLTRDQSVTYSGKNVRRQK